MTAIVDWDDNTESDLAGYLVYHGYASGDYLEFVTVLAPTSTYTFTGLPNDVSSYFNVKAYDTTGNIGAFGTEVSKAATTFVIGGMMVV